MHEFQDNQITQRIPYETLAQVAKKWKEELKREKLAASNAEAPEAKEIR